MKSKSLFLFLILTAVVATTFAQTFSLSDSTTIFKDKDGKILNKEEVSELMKTTFSMTRENTNGKQIITIIPSANDEIAKRNAWLETFKASLINKPIPSFKIPGFDYKVWESNQMKGRVVVMNFWFTTCGPCIKEMPMLNALVTDYRYRNVIFLAPAPENRPQIKMFLKKNPFKYNIIPAARQYISELQVENFPTHLIIDKEGIIRQVFIGYADDIRGKLSEELNKLVK